MKESWWEKKYAEGVEKHLLVSQKERESRLKACNDCENLTKFKRCNLCGCFVPFKSYLADSECKAGKWKTDDQKV